MTTKKTFRAAAVRIIIDQYGSMPPATLLDEEHRHEYHRATILTHEQDEHISHIVRVQWQQDVGYQADFYDHRKTMIYRRDPDEDPGQEV